MTTKHCSGMTGVLEGAINLAERATGKDIDGDGDVGESTRAAKAARTEGPTVEKTNIAENYTWKAHNKKIYCCAELINIVDKCKREGVPLRVLASGWSCNRFIDPTPSKDGDKALGWNIELCGELAEVHEMTETTVRVMAGSMRGPIYAKLDKSIWGPRQLEASGECYTEEESQQVGALIANGVHDTMQRAFTPETVPKLEALVFVNGKATIKPFTAADGDDFYSFFGGMGMTGIIVSATLYHVPKTFYHKLCYLPGVEYMHDPSLEVYKKAMTQEQLVLIHGIKAQCPTDKASEPDTDYLEVEAGFTNPYVSTFAMALKDLVAKHENGRKDVAAVFYTFPQKGDKAKTGPNGLLCGKVCSTDLGRFYRCVNPDGPAEDVPKYTVTEDKFNNISPNMGKEFLMDNTRTTIRLTPALGDVQDSVQALKWKYANLMNLPEDASDDLKELAITDSAKHWAYVDPKVAHTTGPFYIHLWAKATEFYIEVKHIDAFATIAQEAVMDMMAANTSAHVPIEADCRYALGTETGFMTGFYGHDSLAIDFGCNKKQGYTNELYTEMTKKVIKGCKEKGIPVRIHTGKFYVYEEDLTYYMYDQATRQRFGKVTKKHDPEGVFAPTAWRKLFTE